MGIGDLLEVLTIFDWISPTAAIIQDVARGGGETFLIPQTCGFTGKEIERVLRRAGCQTWGLMAINRTFTISVPKSQAELARRALIQHGIPW